MVPYMTGVTKDDGAFIVAPIWKYMDPSNNQLKDHWNKYGPTKLIQALTAKDVTSEMAVHADMLAR